jgi:hypothetical protein
MPTVTLHIGDVRDVMQTLPDNCADVLITSPPFLALRSYLPADHPDKHREIGSEPTPAVFLDTLYGLTHDWGRLVPEWGSICVELGDTMSGSGGQAATTTPTGLRAGQERFDGSARRNNRVVCADGRTIQPNGISNGQRRDIPGWPLAKSMCLIPHLYTIGLAYGHNPLTGQTHPAGQWRIRNVIAWARPNPPVGSLGKRNPERRTGDQKFRPACSYITVACRGTGRYFDLDAVRVEAGPPGGSANRNGNIQKQYGEGIKSTDDRGYHIHTGNPAGAPPLDWHQDQLDGDWLWKLATAPYPGAHYATYPLTLPRRLVLAMCPARVCVTCGWPSERITGEATYVNNAGRPAIIDMDRSRFAKPDELVRHFNTTGAGDASAHRVAPPLGWSDCGHNTWRPGRVLDPFAGSGTTAVAAALESRDCVLIDLDARNVELIDRRLREALHVTNYTVEGNVHTWTLEPALPNQREQADGQLNLLGETA